MVQLFFFSKFRQILTLFSLPDLSLDPKTLQIIIFRSAFEFFKHFDQWVDFSGNLLVFCYVFLIEILNRNFHKNEIVLIGHTLKIILIWLKGISSLLKEKRDEPRRTKKAKIPQKPSFDWALPKLLRHICQNSHPRCYLYASTN